MLDFAEAELDVFESAFLCIFARPGDHFRRHIHADHPAMRADLSRRQEAVESPAGTQIQHDLARFELGNGLRVAATQPQI